MTKINKNDKNLKHDNKKYTIRFQEVNRDTFNDIKDGIKTVETRAASPNYKDIKKGDILVLVCGKDKFEKKVKKAKTFKSISALLRVIPLKKIMPNLSTKKELVKSYHSYPDYKEKIKKFGIVALEL